MAWVETVPEDSIPIGTCFEHVLNGESVLLVRTGQGVFACAPVCPHKAMALEASQLERTKLTCPLHGATFDLRTGDPDDDTDWAGHLDVYPCEVRGGVVHVEVPVKHVTAE